MGGRGARSSTSRLPATIDLDDVRIMHNAGAAYYFSGKVRDTDGSTKRLVPGTSITGVKVIAGSGVRRKIDNIERVRRYVNGSKADEWQKLRGTGYVDWDGLSMRAELHWYSRVNDRRPYAMKVKRYLL